MVGGDFVVEELEEEVSEVSDVGEQDGLKSYRGGFKVRIATLFFFYLNIK